MGPTKEINDTSSYDYFHEEITDEDTMQEVSELFRNTIVREEGITKRDYGSVEGTIEMLRTSPSYVIRMKKNREIVGAFFMKDSPLMRSNKSLYSSQYLIVKPKARGKNVATYAGLEIIPKLNRKYGYVGIFARTALVSDLRKTGSKTSAMLTGSIPRSIYFTKYGWVDDLLAYRSDYNKGFPIDKKDLEIPPLNRKESLMKLVNNSISPKFAFPQLKYKRGEMVVEQPEADEAFDVEEMIRDAAKEGQGFALDEFNSNGFMNRNNIRKGHMLVFKDSSGMILAGAIFGQSKIARDLQATQGGGYFIVRKDLRGQGVGKAILSYGLNKVRSLGYTAILADVFATNQAMLAMLQKEGFIITATVPKSGFIKGNGRTNTYIVYKGLENINVSKL